MMRVAFCALFAASAALATPSTDDLASETKRGMAVASLHGTAADSGSLGAISYLIAIEKDNWKKSSGFQLGFAVGAMRRTFSLSGEQLLPDEKTIINAAFGIFSTKVLELKTRLRMADSQFERLFGAGSLRQATGPEPFPNR